MFFGAYGLIQEALLVQASLSLGILAMSLTLVLGPTFHIRWTTLMEGYGISSHFLFYEIALSQAPVNFYFYIWGSFMYFGGVIFYLGISIFVWRRRFIHINLVHLSEKSSRRPFSSKSLVQEGRAVILPVKCCRDLCMFVFKKADIGLLM